MSSALSTSAEMLALLKVLAVIGGVLCLLVFSQCCISIASILTRPKGKSR